MTFRPTRFTRFLALLVSVAVASPSFATDTSLSDLSVEAFQKKGHTSSSRNPFNPSSVEEIDPANLVLSGTIVGPDAALCLISRRIFKEGDRLGRSVIQEIKPGEVVLKSMYGESPIRMDNYVSGTSQTGDLYEIYLSEAPLGSTLQMLATIGNFNLIIPEKMEGTVSIIFHQTSLKEALGSILRVNKFEYAEENNIVRVGADGTLPVGADLQTMQIPLNYAVAKDVVTRITPILSDKGKAVADDRTNSITLKDRQMVIEQVLGLIDKLDLKDPQVHIEAKIMDVSRNFANELGVQWGFNRNTHNVQGFSSSRTGGYNVNLPASSATSSVGILFGNLIGDTQLEAAITAAEGRGEIRILSKPSVTTLNNTEAKIRSGVTIYYKENADVTVGAVAAESSVTSIETGIELTVTPQITPDNMVKMKITATESEADFSRTVDGIPSVIDNTAETTVLVRDGETAIIGGLVKSRKSQQKRGVPALSYIPILGWLFKSKAIDNTDTELIIFLTPQVIRESTDIVPPSNSAYYQYQEYISGNEKPDVAVPIGSEAKVKARKEKKKKRAEQKQLKGEKRKMSN